MTLQKFDFNSGTQGAAIVSAGNLTVTGSPVTYDSAYASEGARGAKIAQPSATAVLLGVAFPANNSFSVTFYFRADTQVSGQVMEIFSIKAGGSAFPFNLGWSPSNQIYYTDGVGTQVFITPTAGTMLANTWYRFSVTGTTTGSAGATGTVACNIYVGDSLTPLATFTSSTFNFGAGTPDNLVVGGLKNDRTNAWTIGVDYLNVNDGSVTEIGPPPSFVAPGKGAGLAATLRAVSGSSMDPQGAANVWAGTTGLQLLAALNAKAGTVGVGWTKTCVQLNATYSINLPLEPPYDDDDYL